MLEQNLARYIRTYILIWHNYIDHITCNECIALKTLFYEVVYKPIVQLFLDASLKI